MLLRIFHVALFPLSIEQTMLDHLVGRPSANWKRTQVVLTFLAGIWILTKGNTRQLPGFLQRINNAFAGRAPWKIALGSWIAYYIAQNLFLLIGLNAPEPLARLYKRSFYRATWILTALDAGFFTAMPLKPAWLRHICSILFSIYYLVFADAADEKVRRVRATINVDQMRLSWEKGAANPFLSFVSKLLRAPLTIRRVISVDRPLYHSDLPPTEVFVFYAAHPDTFAQQNTVLLQFPGGGFVSMPPPCHEDALAAWANQTGLPIVSVNYKKAPENPYPWPVEECFDFYVRLVQSKGQIIGLSGDQDLRVIVIGDSAGGNLTAAVTLKILAHNELVKTNQKHELNRDDHSGRLEVSALANIFIPLPVGLILIYPALDFEMTCWMTPAQLSLIRSESTTSMIRSKSLQSLLESKDHLSHASPLSVVPDVDKTSAWKRAFGLTPIEKTDSDKEQPAIRERVHHYHKVKSAWESSRLAMTSRMSFFNDRIITAEMMRAMAILYLGPHAYPDFESDYLLSPIVAPAHLLAQFPKTYMICGEKDPFVDDTVIFGGRIRQAKHEHNRDIQEETESCEDFVRVKFLEGMSHAFLQMMAFLPEAHHAARTVGDWVIELAQGTVSADNDSDYVSTSSESNISESTPAMKVKAAARTIVEKGALHVAKMVTTEKDMLNRRKAGLVSDLLSKNE